MCGVFRCHINIEWSKILGHADVPISWEELIGTVEYRRVHQAYRQCTDLNATPLMLSRNGAERALESRQELLEHILEAGRDGLTVQRYKGLGEMNPEQLWETTMDPATRHILQVRIEDAEEADTVFSVLMGEQVEPRREFIERYALDVRNLDFFREVIFEEALSSLTDVQCLERQLVHPFYPSLNTTHDPEQRQADEAIHQAGAQRLTHKYFHDYEKKVKVPAGYGA